MSASKISTYRRPQYLQMHKAIAQAKADARVEGHIIPFRGKTCNIPTDYDDQIMTNVRRYNEVRHRILREDQCYCGTRFGTGHDNTEKINRLRRRRIARKISIL